MHRLRSLNIFCITRLFKIISMKFWNENSRSVGLEAIDSFVGNEGSGLNKWTCRTTESALMDFVQLHHFVLCIQLSP